VAQAEGSSQSGVTARRIGRNIVAHENFVSFIVLMALIGVLSGISRGETTTPTNLVNILLQSSVRGVAALGQAFVILTANIDLSVAGVGVMVMMLGSAMMTTEWRNIVVAYLGAPTTPAMTIPVMLIVGAAWGLLNGTLVTRLGIPSLIATFGVWQIGYGAAYYITEGEAITELPPSLAVFGTLPAAPIIFFSMAVVAYLVLSHTGVGRNIYAVGGNPVSAFLSGINAKRTQLMVFVISGFFAGLAGLMFLSRHMAGSIEGMRGLELDTIAAVTIGGVSLFGGRGNVIGVVIGALLIGVVNNAMSVMQMGHAGQFIVKGAIIIVAVAADILRRRGR
jgi:ribose/xylose/arabinose/galactoside ABC-type transport system permease subunit